MVFAILESFPVLKALIYSLERILENKREKMPPFYVSLTIQMARLLVCIGGGWTGSSDYIKAPFPAAQLSRLGSVQQCTVMDASVPAHHCGHFAVDIVGHQRHVSWPSKSGVNENRVGISAPHKSYLRILKFDFQLEIM